MAACIRDRRACVLTASRFPYHLGYDCAGVVSAVGEKVQRFAVGDEVYVRLPERYRGGWLAILPLEWNGSG